MAWARATAMAVLLAGVLAAVGCGGSDSKPADTKRHEPSRPAAQPVAQPVPKRVIAKEIVPFNRVIAAQDCKSYEPMVLSFLRGQTPGAAATKADCKGVDGSLIDLRGHQVDTAGQFGTAGAMEGPAPHGKRKFTIWVLDGDGRFRYSRVSGNGHELGTPFAMRHDAARAATRFIRATRARDCSVLAPLFDPHASRLAKLQGTPQRACKVLLGGKFFAPAVSKGPAPIPQVMGGTHKLAFVGIPTSKIYFTLVLGNPSNKKLLVFDVLPSTRVKLPKS